VDTTPTIRPHPRALSAELADPAPDNISRDLIDKSASKSSRRPRQFPMTPPFFSTATTTMVCRLCLLAAEYYGTKTSGASMAPQEMDRERAPADQGSRQRRPGAYRGLRLNDPFAPYKDDVLSGRGRPASPASSSTFVPSNEFHRQVIAPPGMTETAQRPDTSPKPRISGGAASNEDGTFKSARRSAKALPSPRALPA